MIKAVEEIYKTSRDYDRLFDLVEAGQRIICVIDYRFRSEPASNPASRDICLARKTSYEINISVRGMSYISIFNDMPDRKDLFKHWCAKENVAWIVPQKDEEKPNE